MKELDHNGIEGAITASTRKMVRSLAEARHRRESGLFVAEGAKCVMDMAPFFKCRLLAATRAWADANAEAFAKYRGLIASRADMERMSSLSTPPQVLAVFEMPKHSMPSADSLAEGLVIALDRIQDPGNLGTIIRVADWMGVTDILASPDTVDVYNPKVVQATMGSLARVKVHYTPLPQALLALAEKVPVYGTLLDDNACNIYTAQLQQKAVLVMGNEGSGVCDDVRKCLTQSLFIPPYPVGADTAESLNVAVATAIALAQFRRQNF